ncbi:hypothetical protein ABH925_007176, partial [Streptacidiphilus sp. EB129]
MSLKPTSPAQSACCALVVQNPKQWKAPSGLITAVPVFRGFPDQQVPST